jgi:hypothetical protein
MISDLLSCVSRALDDIHVRCKISFVRGIESFACGNNRGELGGLLPPNLSSAGPPVGCRWLTRESAAGHRGSGGGSGGPGGADHPPAALDGAGHQPRGGRHRAGLL